MYSLALIYHELLTGVHPYRGVNVQRLAGTRAWPRPSLDLLPAGDRDAVRRALDPDPLGRFTCCAELVEALGAPHGGLTAFTPSPETCADSSAAPPLPSDPAEALSSLSLLLGGLAPPGRVAPTHDAGCAGTADLHARFGANVTPGTAGLKLEGFRQQWGAHVLRVEPEVIVYQVNKPTNFWQRCLGLKQSGLEVTVTFRRPPSLGARLTEVVVQVCAVGCGPEEGARLVRDVAPLLLDSLRCYLQANRERREQQRLTYGQPFTAYPVAAGLALGSPLDCQGKDLSLTGIGFFVARAPQSNRLVLHLPTGPAAGTVTLPATIVRTERCLDGRYEVGARFDFGGMLPASSHG